MMIPKKLPEILATFELDPSGRPLFREGPSPSVNHYKIKLKVLGAPEDAYAVTYLLDESYYEPVRESHDKDRSFAEDLSSYGDFPVKATVRTKQGTFTVVRPLSEALKAGHQESMTPDVQAALAKISTA